MMRIVLGLVLFLTTGLLATSQDINSAGNQDTDSQKYPTIRLNLPADVPSNSVHIFYYMTGPFGGFGSFVGLDKDKSAYEIVASVDGKPANRVKIIAYAAGCQIETFDIPMVSQTASQQLSCVPLEQKILRGQITPPPSTQQAVEVEVTYLAMWGLPFFGINDGFVTAIPVATGIPDQNGDFEVTLPDFGAQSNLGEATLMFTLNELKPGKRLGTLSPEGHGRDPLVLKVESPYPRSFDSRYYRI